MQRISIPVHYDFASTICYVAHRVMERLAPELDAVGVDLDWTPLDLGSVMGWPVGGPVEGPRRENALRVASELGVPVRMPFRWIDSRPAMSLALALRGTPSEPSWRERVWSAVHEEGRSPDDEGELVRLAADLGLALEDDVLRERAAELAERTREAAATGILSLPCFVLAGLPMSGIQEDATMLRMLGRYAERARSSPE